jgi:hypothetical protein
MAFYEVNDVANIPKPGFEACGHCRRHTDGAVNTGKIIPASIERYHMDVVFQLLAVRRSQKNSLDRAADHIGGALLALGSFRHRCPLPNSSE